MNPLLAYLLGAVSMLVVVVGHRAVVDLVRDLRDLLDPPRPLPLERARNRKVS